MTQIHVVPVAEIGHMDRGWTRGHVTGCIAEFPQEAPGYLRFGPILLAAVQEIDARAGYPMHHHEGIETILVVLRGSLAHDDSVGGRGVTGPDDVSVLSAGSGIDHEEMALADPMRAVMFWVRSTTEEPPRFCKATFPRAERQDRLVRVASGLPDATDEAVPLRAPVSLHTGVLSAGSEVVHQLHDSRGAYIVSTDAPIVVNGRRTNPGDRVLVTGPGAVHLRALGATEVVLLDVEPT
jgi:quercetin 2,3-dioxygenase